MGVHFCFPLFASTNSSIMADADAIKKICDIYDWDGKGELDMYYFGDIMYAMGMNIMKSVCVKYGQTNDTGKKFVKFDDVVKLVGDAVKEPNNSGNYQDYIELMKLYDKNENGTIMIAELETFLNLLGDEMPKEDVQKLLIELAPKEDERFHSLHAIFGKALWKSLKHSGKYDQCDEAFLFKTTRGLFTIYTHPPSTVNVNCRPS